MENYKTWDDLKKLNGIVKLVSNPNPYREGVEEYYLVEYVRSLEGKLLLYIRVEQHNENLLKIFSKNNIVVSGDPWYLYDLFARAVWLSRAAGCIQLQKVPSRYNTNLIFACHFESGMINYSKDNNFVKELAKVKNLERREALSNVLKIGNYFFEESNMPYITKEGSSVKINYSTSRKVDRNKENLLSRTEFIPYQTASKPDPYWTDITTRGLFHHLGDDVAFMFAASEYGEVYVIGNDEFGDLIILGGLPYAKSNSSTMRFKVGEVISSQDVDFLYGVPRGEARYPSKFNSRFNYSTEKTGNCKLNNEKNSAIGNYWDSQVFKKYAKRKIDSYTFNEFSNLMVEKIYNVLDREEFKAQKIAFDKTVEFFNSEELKFLLNDLNSGEERSYLLRGFNFKDENIGYYCNISMSYEYDSLRIYANYDDSCFLNEVEKSNLNSSEDEISKEKFESKCFYIKDIENVSKDIDDLLSEIQYEKLNSNEANVFFKNMRSKLIANYKQYLTILELQDSFNNTDFNNAIYKELSLFYKTTAHKVHCEIINPTNDSQLGFFLKNTKNKSKIDGSLFNDIISLQLKKLSKENPELDFEKEFNEYFLNRLYKDSGLDSSYKKLLRYWKKIDNKAFVVSDLVDMQNEYRIFVVNHRPVAGSPCFRNSTPFDAYNRGRFDPRLCVGHSAYETYQDENTRKRVAQYAKLARDFCKEMKDISPDTGSYVLDVAWSDDINSPLAIEINTVSWSGAYQIDMRRVCAAVAKKPFHYGDMEKYGNYEKVLRTINGESDPEEEVLVITEPEEEVLAISESEKILAISESEDDIPVFIDEDANRTGLENIEMKNNITKNFGDSNLPEEIIKALQYLDDFINSDNQEENFPDLDEPDNNEGKVM